jgi:hypothetical protein
MHSLHKLAGKACLWVDISTDGICVDQLINSPLKNPPSEWRYGNEKTATRRALFIFKVNIVRQNG